MIKINAFVFFFNNFRGKRHFSVLVCIHLLRFLLIKIERFSAQRRVSRFLVK